MCAKSPKDKKALVVGIANEHSIAYGCASAFREPGANLAVTYLNEKAEPYVEALARTLDARIFLPLDVSKPGALEVLFERIAKDWGRLDILVQHYRPLSALADTIPLQCPDAYL